MKRFFSLILIVVSIMQAAYADAAAEDNASYNMKELSKAVYVLNNLEITMLQEDTEIWQNKSISRAEFGEMICKAFKIQTSSESIYFTDVPYDMWAYGAVTALAEAGIVSVPESRIFRPNDAITYVEALKMVLTAADYDVYANAVGGFPQGYIKTAQKVKLDFQGSGTDTITVSDAVMLIYDVMSMGFYEPAVISTSDVTQYRESGETIFAVLWDTYIERGRVNAYYGASYQGAVSEKNQVIIDDIRYTMAEEACLDDYFLNRVEFIYKKPDDKDGNIIYMEDTGLDDIIIQSDDIAGFDNSNYTVNYYKGSGEIKKAVERGAVLIYNGAIWDGSVTKVFDEFVSGDKRGSVRLKSLGGNGIDTIIVKSYRNFVTGYADLNYEKIYNMFDSSDVIDMTAYEYVVVRNLENDNITPDFSNLPVLISVAESKDKSTLEIVVCRERVTGTPEKISGTAEDTVFTINGQEYKIDYLMYKNQMLDENGNAMSISSLKNVQYEFYIDRFGRIAYMNTLGAGDGFSLGYVIDGIVEEDGFDKNVVLKILTETGEISELYIRDRVTVDGEVYKLSSYISLMNAIEKGAEVNSTAVEGAVNSGKLSPQLIRYITDSENKISKIDTVFIGETENKDNTLTVLQTVNGIERTMYHVTGGMPKFGSNILFSTTDTKVFSKPLTNEDGKLVVLSEPATTVTENVLLPSDSGNFPKKTVVTDASGNPAEPEDKMYKRGIPEGSFSGDIGYYTQGYKYNPNTPYCDALVYNYGVWYSKLENVFFDELGEKYTEDEEIVKVLYGWERGAKVEYEIGDGSDVSDLERGDIVYCWTDSTKTKIAFVKKVYDAGEDIFVNRPYTESSTRYYPDYMWIRGYWSMNASTGEITSYTYRTKNSLTKGKVLSKTGTAMKWDWDGNYRTFEEIFDFSNIPIVIYDKSLEKDNVFIGSVADVPDYETVGENAARIVLNKDRERGVCAFIYLND